MIPTTSLLYPCLLLRLLMKFYKPEIEVGTQVTTLLECKGHIVFLAYFIYAKYLHI